MVENLLTVTLMKVKILETVGKNAWQVFLMLKNLNDDARRL